MEDVLKGGRPGVLRNKHGSPRAEKESVKEQEATAREGRRAPRNRRKETSSFFSAPVLSRRSGTGVRLASSVMKARVTARGAPRVQLPREEALTFSFRKPGRGSGL